MRALLDTHTFLWWIYRRSAPIPAGFARLLVMVRMSSSSALPAVGEMAIKAKLGRLQLPDNLETLLNN
jgi:PIN domain nuclease of toxin-antitoxin system